MVNISADKIAEFEAAVQEFIEYAQDGQDFAIEFQTRLNHGNYLIGQRDVQAAMTEYVRLVNLMKKIDQAQLHWAPRALNQFQKQIADAIKSSNDEPVVANEEATLDE